jgi:hypothetical protein
MKSAKRLNCPGISAVFFTVFPAVAWVIDVAVDQFDIETMTVFRWACVGIFSVMGWGARSADTMFGFVEACSEEKGRRVKRLWAALAFGPIAYMVSRSFGLSHMWGLYLAAFGGWDGGQFIVPMTKRFLANKFGGASSEPRG